MFPETQYAHDPRVVAAEALAGQRPRDQRGDHVEDGREQERFPRYDDVGDAEEEGGKRGEGEDHDHVVHTDLHQCVSRISAR